MSVHVNPATATAGEQQVVAAPPAPAGGRRRRGRFAFLSRWDIKVSPYVYVAPFFLLFAAFGVYPMLYTLFVALQKWTLGSDIRLNIGGHNFVELWHDDAFWNSVFNTFGLFVFATVPQLLGALVLANLLNRINFGRTFFRLAVVIPVATSTAVVGIVFNQLYSTDFGIVNWLLHLVGVHPVDWHSSQPGSWFAIVTMVNWRWTGYNALIYLAAMQAIPKDLYESASLDGASATRQFFRITIPMLRPTIIFTVIISTIGGIQLFGEPVTFKTGAGSMQGGTTGQFQTVTMYLYQEMFERQRLGYAGAIAWVIVLLTALTVLINFTLVRRINSDK
ncbi:MAG TPA: sugar ABC transporter permease [Micromonosporaceae bacterium]|nr:sugar ABC transporter permease [Micromonosporaceae bacterium]